MGLFRWTELSLFAVSGVACKPFSQFSQSHPTPQERIVLSLSEYQHLISLSTWLFTR